MNGGEKNVADLKQKAAGLALVVAMSVAGFYEGKTNHAIIPVPGDVPTICRGHTDGVKLGMTATDRQCDEWFKQDMAIPFRALDRLVTVPMPETRRGALASFIFNVGEGAFARSTLLKKLNAGDTVGACNEMMRWVNAGGKKLRGLVRRRDVERGICLLEPAEEPFWKIFLQS